MVLNFTAKAAAKGRPTYPRPMMASLLSVKDLSIFFSYTEHHRGGTEEHGVFRVLDSKFSAQGSECLLSNIEC